MLFSSAEIFDDKGNVCARASGVVSVGKDIDVEKWAHDVARAYGGTT
jgi:hypothetical protein